MVSLASLWPRAQVRQLQRQNEALNLALRNSTDKAADYLAKLEELRSQPCSSCEVLKQTVNFHVLAAGSKVGMFDGVGPTLKPIVPLPSDSQAPQQAPIRASKLAKIQRQNFLDDFFKNEGAQLEAELANLPEH